MKSIDTVASPSTSQQGHHADFPAAMVIFNPASDEVIWQSSASFRSRGARTPL
jgi:hypothetical protein